jgi:4-amino-4-deoxy-L-arabinose transferase-like glycosyltransferase
VSIYSRRAILVVLGLAIAARAAAYIVDPKPDYLTGLAVYQGEMARNIVDHGRWFVVNEKALGLMGRTMQREHLHLVDPANVGFEAVDRKPILKPEILEMPGLAVPLAGLWWATGAERYAYIRWLQIALDALMVVLVYWIALQVIHRRSAALAAASLYGLWPGAILLATTPSLDTWAGFFVVSALAIFLWARRDGFRMRSLALLGGLVGLGVYFRPFIIVLPIAFALAELKRTPWRQTLRVALVPTLVAALFLIPWTVRNFAEFNRFIPTRVGIGQALWEGLGQAPNNFGAVDNDEAALEYVRVRRPDLRFPTPAFDDYLLRKSLRAIAHHPLIYLELIVRRALYLAPCLLALIWRKRFPFERALLVATAAAVTLPYVLLRMEDRFWLPASFAYLILLAGLADGYIRSLRAATRGRDRFSVRPNNRLRDTGHD